MKDCNKKLLRVGKHIQSMNSVQDNAEELYESLNNDLDIDFEEVKSLFEEFAEYQVSGQAAKESVAQRIAKDYDVNKNALLTTNNNQSVTKIENIDEPDEWLSIEGEIVELWNNETESINQVGLIADDTGVIKFTRWEDEQTDVTLKEGETYKLQSVVTGEYKDNIQANLNEAAEIIETEVEMDIQQRTRENEVLTGYALVDIYDSEGLIKRCSVDECTRVLSDGDCSEHGDVEPVFDLRIKGVIDDGETTQTVVIQSDEVDEMTGLTIEEAQEMAKDALDTQVVVEHLKQELCPTYWRFTGFETGRQFICTDIERPDIDGVRRLVDSWTAHMTEKYVMNSESEDGDNYV
jgi:ssDNA-binding replication factor A large subunit